MYKFGRIVGALFAVAMFAFSVFAYLRTGDWVAALFAVGSLGYLVFFLAVYQRNAR